MEASKDSEGKAKQSGKLSKHSTSKPVADAAQAQRLLIQPTLLTTKSPFLS